MSRSGYDDGCEHLTMYRGQVASAIRGKRGQAMLCDLRDALDAMPEKRLIGDFIMDNKGGVCALGALGKHKGVDMHKLDASDDDVRATMFNVSECLIREVEYMNDEAYFRQTPERRWETMRKWVEEQIKA